MILASACKAQEVVRAEAAPAVGAALWQRSMPRQPRDRIELGFGLTVQRELRRDAQPHGPLAADRGADTSSLGGAEPPRGELGMGLSFRRHGEYDDLRRGLDMRMELSGATVLTVRPRGGRVTVQLSSRW